MRKFKDIESGKIVTEEELRHEYLQKLQEQPEEYAEMCFADYIRNSLTAHNGTLEEIMEQQTKREEVIFDATAEVTGVYGEEFANTDIDSRDVFAEIRKFVDFWMTAYEPVTKEIHMEDTYLELVTLAALAWFKSWLGQDMTQDDELMLCNNQRVAQYVRENKMTLYDYDCWSNLEEVIGEPLTYEEFHKLNAEILDEPMSIAVCEGNRKDLKARLDYIRKPKVRYRVNLEVRKSVFVWVEVPEDAGREQIMAEAREQFVEGNEEDDEGWDNEESDIVSCGIDYDSVQEV